MPAQENGFDAEPPAEVTAPGIDIAALERAVDDGSLWIDSLLVADGAHERCARQYEQLADRVEAQIQVLRAATELPGFGDFSSGAALRAGFERKADHAITRLTEYAGSARELAQLFRAAAATYQQADQAFAAAIERGDGIGAGYA
ncbi:type VII secretion target [Nocardia sp. 004]|uniref:type VII secretion target n=1 Tax=Nocardia sp. 004 TaxID=3385978 RepID=UPI0039A09D4A